MRNLFPELHGIEVRSDRGYVIALGRFNIRLNMKQTSKLAKRGVVERRRIKRSYCWIGIGILQAFPKLGESCGILPDKSVFLFYGIVGAGIPRRGLVHLGCVDL